MVVTATRWLTSDFQVKVKVIERDEHGRFKGKSQTFTVENADVGKRLVQKAKESTTINQFRGRIKNDISGRHDIAMNNAFSVALNNVAGYVSDRTLAIFNYVMEQIGPQGLDDFYKKNPELFNELLEYYNYNYDDEIRNRRQKADMTVLGYKRSDFGGVRSSSVDGFIQQMGYTEKEVIDKIREIATKEFMSTNPTQKEIDAFKKNGNAIYEKYLENHYADDIVKKWGIYW